jgi:anti-sigma factor RsiW
MMTHERALELLDDFAGGELGERERGAVERHLAGCAACSAEVEALRALLDETRFLPRGIAPPRDLWAGVAARLEPRGDAKVIPFRPRQAWQPPRWVLAMAASLVLVVTTALVTARVVGGGAGEAETRLPDVVVTGTRPAAPTAFAAFQPAERDYQRAIGELQALLETQKHRLAPQTVATLEANLRIIDEAIRQSRAALEKDPNSPELAQMLSGVYEAKVETLRQVVEL